MRAIGITLATFVFVLAAQSVAAAAPAPLRGIVVTDAWTRATPPGSTAAAVYLRVTNLGMQQDELLIVRSPASASAMIHETQMANGMARMRPTGALVLAGRGSVAFEPNGRHIMLMGLARPLTAGAHISLVLQFRRAGAVPVDVVVRPLGAAP